jgi:hypothetical protein
MQKNVFVAPIVRSEASLATLSISRDEERHEPEHHEPEHHEPEHHEPEHHRI